MSNRESVVEIKIPAKSEFLRIVRLMISGFASRLPMSINEVENLKVAVSEACNAAIDFAESTGAEGSVIIRCWEQDGSIVFEVVDASGGLAMGAEPEPESVDADRLELGLGFLLIKTLMDEVDVKSSPEEGASITMKKKIPAA